MAWKELRKNSFGRSAHRGAQWSSVPCVSVIKNGIGFNQQFLDAFGLIDGSLVLVFIDSEKRMLGLRQATSGEDESFAYKIGRGQKSKGKTFYMTCGRISRAFPDCVGHAYRAHLNPGERMIVIEMSPDNRSR